MLSFEWEAQKIDIRILSAILLISQNYAYFTSVLIHSSFEAKVSFAWALKKYVSLYLFVGNFPKKPLLRGIFKYLRNIRIGLSFFIQKILLVHF